MTVYEPSVSIGSGRCVIETRKRFELEEIGFYPNKKSDNHRTTIYSNINM